VTLPLLVVEVALTTMAVLRRLAVPVVEALVVALVLQRWTQTLVVLVGVQ
jgi:hypothetical protein